MLIQHPFLFSHIWNCLGTVEFWEIRCNAGPERKLRKKNI